jgi:hypothetical protein
MDVRYYVTESANFTRATLLGRPSRWLIFILLGLPWTILLSHAESQNIIEGTVVHWSQIPWGEAGLLIGAGFLCNFLISGYVVRLLRADPVPPEFDDIPHLCLDGIKLQAIPLVWMLVPSVLAYIQYSIGTSEMFTDSPWESSLKILLILLLLVIEIVVVYIAVQHVMIGAIRFARTHSVGEGFNQIAIRKTLSRIGILNYFIGLGVITVVWMLFSLSLRGVALFPFAGPGISLLLSPIPTIYCFRFIAHFCDEDRLQPGEHAGPAEDRPVSPPVQALVSEFLAWFAIYTVLLVLCFTPIVLVAGSFTGFFR